MPVKSTWSSSKGEVTRIACKGAFTQPPSCWIYLSQLLIAFCICIAMPGHQNWSCNRDSVCHWPWCPASLWHPFMATSWLYELWGLQTTELLPSLFPGYGGDRGHPDRSMNFFLSLRMAMPSSVVVWSPRRCFRSCTLWEEIHSITILSMGSSHVHSYPVCYMQVYIHVSGPCLDCSFFNLLMYSSISLSHHSGQGHWPF